MFKLLSSPIDVDNFKKQLVNAQAGAFASFEGWVRDHNEGQSVDRLEYEAHAELCQIEAQKIIAEAKVKFSILDCFCVHRTGPLAIGEMAVWVGVVAAHRAAAFEACRFIIDELKSRLPIWKKEYYSDGRSEWVNCQHCTSNTLAATSNNQFYSRQINLPEIGFSGQKKINNAKVLVVGAGGLGSAVLTSLTSLGVGTIGICEYDVLDASNLHRQSLYKLADVGKPKLDLAISRLKSLNPQINFIPLNDKIDARNASEYVKGYDVLVDCSDNFATKFLLNDVAVLTQTPLVTASIYQWEGQMQVVILKETACLRCIWPSVPEKDCVGNCAQAGVVGILPQMLGQAQAMQVLNIILDQNQEALNQTYLFDLKNFNILKLNNSRSKNCPLCSASPKITQVSPELYQSQNDFMLNLDNISLEQLENLTLIDVREKHERMLQPIRNFDSLHFPSKKYLHQNIHLDIQKKYLCVCSHGVRSLAMTRHIKKLGFNVLALDVGVEDFNQKFINKVLV